MADSFSDIYSTTWEFREKKPADAVADNIPFLYFLRKHGGIKVGNFGRFISENIEIAQNQYVQLIDPDEEITMGYNNTLGAFQFTPKIIVTPMVINELEKAQNSGDNQFLDLMDERQNIGDKSTWNVMEAMMQGDGTTYGGKAFAGIRSYVVDSTGSGSIGGLARGTYTAIRNASVNLVSTFTGATDSSNIESRMRYLKNLIVRNSDKPDLLLCGQTYFNAGADSFSGKQRITTNDDVFDATFDNYKIEGMTAVLAAGKIFSGLSHIAADRAYALNTKTFNLKMYSGYNIQPLNKRTSFNQLVDAAILLGIGQLTINGPGLNGVAYDS
jgi:hypothetical protein